jgi:hypothetical protein
MPTPFEILVLRDSAQILRGSFHSAGQTYARDESELLQDSEPAIARAALSSTSLGNEATARL